MSVMEDASLVEYARCFGLARRFGPDYAIDLLKKLASTTPAPPIQKNELVHHCDDFFLRLKQERESLIDQLDQPPIKVSHRAFEILASCQAPTKPDIESIYHPCAERKQFPSRLKLDEPLLKIGGGEPRGDARRIRNGVDCQLLLHMRVKAIAGKHAGARFVLPDELAVDFSNALYPIYSEINTAVIEVTLGALRMLGKAITRRHDIESIAEAIESDLPQRHSWLAANTNPLIDVGAFEQDVNIYNGVDAVSGEVHFEGLNTTIPTWDDIKDELESSETVLGSKSALSEDYVDNILQPEAALPGSAAQRIIPASDINLSAKVTTPTENTDICSYSMIRPCYGKLPTEKAEVLFLDSAEARSPNSTVALQCPDDRQSSTKVVGNLKFDNELAVTKFAVPKLEEHYPIMEACEISSLLEQTAKNVAIDQLACFIKLPLIDLVPFNTFVADATAEDDVAGDQSALQRWLRQPKAGTRSEQLLWKEPGLRLLEEVDQNDYKLLTTSTLDLSPSTKNDPSQEGDSTASKSDHGGSQKRQLSAAADRVNQFVSSFITTGQPYVQEFSWSANRSTKPGPSKLRLSRSTKEEPPCGNVFHKSSAA